MAIIHSDSLFHGASGRMGEIVFRTRNGKTFASSRPACRKKKPTTHQMETQTKFIKAVAFAKAAISQISTRLLYAAAAKGRQTAYNIALSDAFHAPIVHSIDAGGYNGKVKDAIRLIATDNFKVAKVTVAIYSAKGELIEQGSAVQQEDELQWEYRVAKSRKHISGCTITATAEDLPGNKGSYTITL